jgi:hypothetical protein
LPWCLAFLGSTFLEAIICFMVLMPTVSALGAMGLSTPSASASAFAFGMASALLGHDEFCFASFRQAFCNFVVAGFLEHHTHEHVKLHGISRDSCSNRD